MTLGDQSVRRVLDRLEDLGAHDAETKAAATGLERDRGRPLEPSERLEVSRDASLSITPKVGRLLYALAVAKRPRLAVEFGASLGYSTIHLAAAIHDVNTGGQLITTELDPHKAAESLSNLRAAGLTGHVEMRVGDARQTLATIDEPIELLFLDGWNEHYLEVMDLLEPRLRHGAVVIADLSTDDPASDAYRAHMEANTADYATVTLPLDAGVVLSVRLDSDARGLER